ncbi:MAG: cyclic nucleotide-binding/CBS domain-containing protein [Nitrospinota bacterium]
MADEYFESVDSYDEEQTPRDRRTLEAVALDRPIRDLPLRDPLCLEDSRPASDAIKLMREHRTGSVLVTRNRCLAGIFTERDVLNRISLGEVNAQEVPLAEVMRADPEVLSPDSPMAYALNLMSVGGFRHVPLVDQDRRPVAVVSVRDIVKYRVDHFPDKVLNLPPRKEGPFPGSREGA